MRQSRATTYRRTGRSQEERRVIRIYAEGAVTEYEYLNHWERKNRRVVLEWGESGMAPMSLVGCARNDLKLSRRATSRRGIPDFDELWCMFDIDAHPNVSQAVFEARQSGIDVIISNPCFELWLVLHHENQNAHIDRRKIQRRASDLSLVEGKSIPDSAWNELEDNYDEARLRAQALDRMHSGNASPPRSNPSTDVWRLVDRIRS